MRVVFQAIPFCYGPASHAIAIASQLRSLAGASPLELYAIAEQPALELLACASCFDAILPYSTREPASPAVRELLDCATHIVSVGDFDFLQHNAHLHAKMYFVDALFWMWCEVPNYSLCRRYYVLDFPPVRARLDALPASERRPILVGQICQLMAPPAADRTDQIILHFGGMTCPHGCNITLAVALVEDVICAMESTACTSTLLVRAGSLPVRALTAQLRHRPSWVDVAAVPQARFHAELLAARALCTVPGMSIIYEALSAAVPMMLLLPLNYSQHLQTAAYRGMLRDFASVSWDLMPGFATLPPGLEESVGVSKALAYGSRYATCPAAREVMRTALAAFLLNTPPPVRALEPRPARGPGSVAGALEIAEDLLAEQ